MSVITFDAASASIGIILSGAVYDGIQYPVTAQFPLMPQGPIAFDHPDNALTPEEIVHKLIQQ